jgi:uncharacterized protein (DUF1800 family)
MLDPLPPKDWSIALAYHLMVRAGFGGTPEQIADFHRLGLPGAVELLLSEAPPAPLMSEWEEPESLREKEIAAREAMRAGNTQDALQLRGEVRKEKGRAIFQLRDLWLTRMATTDRPLHEKLTLFWHGHFATSIEKVREPKWMWIQNETFRSRGAGLFGDLAKAISRDPAMIRWLDLDQSSENAPNENFARELLELFTLGEGHYMEADIKEAARAFTGYRTNRESGNFMLATARHDDGQKSFMGEDAAFDGDGIVDVILQNRQCGRFLGRRLWEFFAGIEPTPQFEKLLGDTLRQEDYEIRPFLKRIFLSKLFYSPRLVGAQIKSPVQWLLQACRSLEQSPPPALIARTWFQTLGQELFAPPNVRGWEGGRSWMSATTITARANFAGDMVGTTRARGGGKTRRAWPPADPTKWDDVTAATGVTEKSRALAARLYGPAIPSSAMEVAESSLKNHGTDTDGLRICAHALMSLPEYQLT